MIRNNLSRLLFLAAIKVEENNMPDHIKAQLKVRKDALIQEVNGYRNSLATLITPSN
jgi:hypothetical protein